MIPQATRGPPEAPKTPGIPRSGFRWTITALPLASNTVSGPSERVIRLVVCRSRPASGEAVDGYDTLNEPFIVLACGSHTNV